MINLQNSNKKCILGYAKNLPTTTDCKSETTEQAEGYFDQKFSKANGFLRNASYNYNDKDYVLASFMLHQTCENLFYAVRLAFTLESNKQHNLTKLLNSVRKYSPQFDELLPQKTDEEKRLFNLLKAAYVEARYNPAFLVTKEDIDALMPVVEHFSIFVKELCEERIREYESLSVAGKGQGKQ